jgi:hypothetical protein
MTVAFCLILFPALEESEAASETLVEKIEELEQSLFELKGDVAAGQHIPPGMRVLAFRDNPAQRWEDLRQEAVDRLRAENEALLARLKALEDSGVRNNGTSQSEDLVPRASWDSLQREKEELEDVVKQREKRLRRLQEASRSSYLSFQDAMPDHFVDLYCQKRGIPRRYSIYSRRQTCFLPQRAGSSHLSIRPFCVLCVPARTCGRRRRANAACCSR